jgi:hypothetical protein
VGPECARGRGRQAWVKARLHPITLHECRHSYAAYMIAAGIDGRDATSIPNAPTIATNQASGRQLTGNGCRLTRYALTITSSSSIAPSPTGLPTLSEVFRFASRNRSQKFAAGWSR